MSSVVHKKSDWYEKFELAGVILQIIISLAIMVILAVMASQVSTTWNLFR